MIIDFDIWRKCHSACVKSVQRLCDLRSNTKDSVKCNSALCVMKNAMQDIRAYFEKNTTSAAELCFLIRNIDVIVTGLLDINNILLGVGLNRTEKAIEKCFVNKEIVNQFRILRSLILAHPVDTHYINDKGESETVYLEDIRPFNHLYDSFTIKKECEYVKVMCKPESNSSFFEPLSIDDDIVPVIITIIDSIEQLTTKIDSQIEREECDLSQIKLDLEYDSIYNYIISLDCELEKRYPSAVENVIYANGETKHYSIVYQCLTFFNASFSGKTQEKYNVFLDYIKGELRKIELDLQKMEFNEDNYFKLIDDSDLASDLSYESSKMEYLLNSDDKSYTEEFISNDPPTDALWGIRCFRILIPYIQKFIPVDLSVSDKELYCQYAAAKYLCCISKYDE